MKRTIILFVLSVIMPGEIEIPDWADPKLFDGRTPHYFCELCEGRAYLAQWNGVVDANSNEVPHTITLENVVPGMIFDPNTGKMSYTPTTPDIVSYAYWTIKVDPNICAIPDKWLFVTGYKINPSIPVEPPEHGPFVEYSGEN